MWQVYGYLSVLFPGIVCHQNEALGIPAQAFIHPYFLTLLSTKEMTWDIYEVWAILYQTDAGLCYIFYTIFSRYDPKILPAIVFLDIASIP